MVSDFNLQERAVDTSTGRPAESVLPCNLDSGGGSARTREQRTADSGSSCDSSPEAKRNRTEESPPETTDKCDLVDMQLGDDWEASFVAFSKRKQAKKHREETDEAPPDVGCPYEHHPTEEIMELLDLDKDGIPVSWPQGLDPRVAKLIVQDRAKRVNAARSPERARAS